MATANLEDGHDPRPAIEQVLHHLLAEARELEMPTELGHSIRPIKAVAEESVIAVLRSLDFAPILITAEANGRYTWRWMQSEGSAPTFLAALREVLLVAVVGILPRGDSAEENEPPSVPSAVASALFQYVLSGGLVFEARQALTGDGVTWRLYDGGNQVLGNGTSTTREGLQSQLGQIPELEAPLIEDMVAGVAGSAFAPGRSPATDAEAQASPDDEDPEGGRDA